MGCCLSTNNPPEKKGQIPLKDRHLPESDKSYINDDIDGRKAPPPLEEETVKEVLSEISTSKLPSFLKIEEIKNNPENPSFPEIDEEKIEEKHFLNAPEEISEISEIGSLSESISTTTVTDQRKEVRVLDKSPSRVLRKRSDSGDFAGRIDSGRNSPARKPEPSPGRRNDIAGKPLQTREVGQITRRPISGSNGLRRDPGESSSRRMSSPATRATPSMTQPGICRSPSSRMTGSSPGRLPGMTPGNRRNVEVKKEENRPTDESLENPLVSLECFIFL